MLNFNIIRLIFNLLWPILLAISADLILIPEKKIMSGNRTVTAERRIEW